MGIGRWLSTIAVVAVAAACHVSIGSDAADDARASLKKDGAACGKPEECHSDACVENVCAGSTCGSTEPDAATCEPGWSCKYHDGSCLIFFCSSPGYTCVATCGAGCPTGTYCPAGNTDPGTACQYGAAPPPPLPSAPEVEISSVYYANPNQQIQLTAHITNSDNVPITATTWDFGDGSPAGSGEQVMHAFAKLGVYSVKVSVTDSYNRVATDDQTVGVCVEPGTACTTDGDCCDAPSNVCLKSGVCGSPF